jgi:CRP/FNR family transcriptional regulator, cyclic AMP receptor protein
MKPSLADSPKLRKFLKTFSPGSLLFKQGELGSTLFFVVRGMVELVFERDGSEHVTEIVEAGGFLGERALVTKEPYRRYYSARANQETQALEINSKDLELLKITVPELMTDLMTGAFEVAAKRLHRMNTLVNALRYSDNALRFMHCVLYYCKETGTPVPNGIEVPLSIAGFAHYTDMTVSQIERYFGEMEEARLIEKLPNGFYLVPSVDAIELAADRERARSKG